MRMLSLPLLALAVLPAVAQKPCGNTPVYSPCEVVLDLPPAVAAKNPNPPATVELWAEFRSPEFKTYKFPAFWDGGSRMVFRVTPVEVGNYTYRLSGNVPEFEGKEDKFTSVANPDATAFIKRANAHHWQYTEALKPHLYFGADFTDLASVETRARQKFTHLALPVFSTKIDPAFFKQVDERVAAINGKGMVADLIVTPTPADFVKAYTTWSDRERFLRYLAARYSAFNITWQLAGEWESSPNARPILKEVGVALKGLDPYGHPRSARSAVTSAPLGPDGWMDFVINGAPDLTVPAIEHIANTVPQVVLVDAALPEEAFRKRVWNAAISGAYLSITGNLVEGSANAKTATGWFDTMSRTRFWDIEPYFDLDGGRAMANPETEYLVYIEHPQKVEMTVEKHSYDVYWVNPSTGEAVKEKKDWKGELYEGTPPDATRDWILHLSRDGRKEGMLKSYKFESWPIPVQEPERSAVKAPFELVSPASDTVLKAGEPVKFEIRLKKKTAGTRRMMFMLAGEIVPDGQGTRILATGTDGTLVVPAVMLAKSEGPMNVRLYALNAPGKLYILDYVFTVKK
ncbi:MAG: DUF5060 domain-containing protein [Acidobacteria bacterium]|nr:DUF5060 domain-containing protein [Acidobacteriota bacterium]